MRLFCPRALSLLLPFAFAAFTSAPPARAQASAGANASRTATTEEVLESTRRSVRSTTEWLARSVDSWFGDKPFKDGGTVSDGVLTLRLHHRPDEGADLSLRFNARLRLPNLEERAYLFVGRDNPRDVVTDKPGAFTRAEQLRTTGTEERSFFAGLGLTLHDEVDFRLGLRGGLKPYAQARFRRPWQLGPSGQLEFRQTLFWSVDDHLGSTTALSYEHALSSTLAARWLNAATITQQHRKFEWSSILGSYKSFAGQRLLSLEALASGRQGADVAVLDYGLQAKWEQPVYRDWLFGQGLVGHFWPRPDATSPRGRAWALGAGLKMLF